MAVMPSMHTMLAMEASMKNCEGEEDLAGGINVVWRQKVAMWCYHVVDYLNESRAVVYLAMNILDRYCTSLLSKAGSIDEETYELASLTALFLAVRISGSGSLRMSQLLPLSRKGFTVRDVMTTGTAIIEAVDLSQRILTPFDFITSLLQYIPRRHASLKTQIRESACYLAELAVCDIVLASYTSSEIALAAMSNTIASRISNSSVTSEFQAAAAKSMDDASISQNMDQIRSRLQGIYRQSLAEEDTLEIEVVQLNPVVRVVSFDDLEQAASNCSMKRSRASYFYQTGNSSDISPRCKRQRIQPFDH